MNELALFAGAGGGILGGILNGWRTICAVEINPYCASLLLQRQNEGNLPPFPIWDDVCSFNGSDWKGYIDVVSGGFPCQPFSTATHGIVTATDFWPEMYRIVGEVEPEYVFAENVAERAIKKAAKDLQAIGYKTEYLCLSAKDLGADHLRRRYWLLAHSNLCGKLRGSVDAETSELPIIRSGVWESYPNESRMADGLANRMDRIRATGNGQVPIVAAIAWRLLKEIV